MNMKEKFGLKPKKLFIEYDGEIQEFYAKPISYNLALFIAREFNEVIQQLTIIRHTLCDENGVMEFEEDTPFEVIGDTFPFEVISLMTTEIAKSSGPNANAEVAIKKPVASQ